MWHFKQPQSHKPTAEVAHALEFLDDHVFRGQPAEEGEIARCHQVMHDAYGDLDPDDKAHLKMRLGMIGHQDALAEHEKRESAEAATPPDMAAELVRLRAELAAVKRDNAARKE